MTNDGGCSQRLRSVLHRTLFFYSRRCLAHANRATTHPRVCVRNVDAARDAGTFAESFQSDWRRLVAKNEQQGPKDFRLTGVKVCQMDTCVFIAHLANAKLHLTHANLHLTPGQWEGKSKHADQPNMRCGLGWPGPVCCHGCNCGGCPNL